MGKDLAGAILGYSVMPMAAPRRRPGRNRSADLFSGRKSADPFSKRAGWPGTYESFAAATDSPRVAFIHSSLEKPGEVYIAESADKLAEARPFTSFNRIFAERDLPKGKPYHWTADDGATIEGMLMYPAGKI